MAAWSQGGHVGERQLTLPTRAGADDESASSDSMHAVVTRRIRFLRLRRLLPSVCQRQQVASGRRPRRFASLGTHGRCHLTQATDYR